MDKEIISTKQGIFIMTIFIIGSFIVIGSGGQAKQDVWIAILLAMIMSLPVIFIYSQLLTLYPGKDLYDILAEVFGKIAGKIISLLFIWYTFHLGSMVIRNFSEFVNVVSFPETPMPFIVILIGVFCIWMVKAGIEVMGRWSTFAFPIGVTVIGIAVILSLSNAHFGNLKPVLYDGFKPVLTNGFSIFTFPFAETVVFTIVLNRLKTNKRTFRVFFISILISAVTMLIVCVRNVLVLGAPLTSDFYFPSYTAVRTINIADFLQRIEIIVAINLILGGFIKISVCLYAAVLGVTKFMNIENYRYLVVPVGFLMMSVAVIVYKNTMEMFDWAQYIYPYYAIPFQIVLPIIILIVAKIKIKIKGKKQQPGQEQR